MLDHPPFPPGVVAGTHFEQREATSRLLRETMSSRCMSKDRQNFEVLCGELSFCMQQNHQSEDRMSECSLACHHESII